MKFQKELILIKQVHQKSVMFVTIGFKFQLYVCNKYHDLLMMPMNLSDTVILNIKGSEYHCIINKISKMKLKIVTTYLFD